MLKELKAHHRNVIQMSFNGYKNGEIAERLGMTQSTVSLIINSPLGKAYLDGLQDKAQKAALDVRKELISMNKTALDTFKRLLDPKGKVPAAVQYNTAKDILDRTGYKASDKLDLNFTLKNKSDEELDAEINAIEKSISRQTASIEKVEVSTEITDFSSEESCPALPDPATEEAFQEVDSLETSSTLETSEVDDSSEEISLSDKIQAIIEECSNSTDKDFNPFRKID